MNLEQTVADQPLPADTIIEQDAPEPEAPTSILDHAKQFGPNAEKADPVEEPVDPLKPIRPVDQQKRDQGKFAEGRKPMKAKDAVERINQLTGRAKTAEERASAAESRLQSAEGELQRLRSQHAPAAQIAKAEEKVERAEAKIDAPSDDPYPSEDDPKYGGDYGKVLEDRARWAARDEYRKREMAQREQTERQRQQQEHHERLGSFTKRIDAAKGRYQDFEQVAFQQAVPWDDGSAIDAWIMEDDAGPDVLYYLQSHRQERDALLGMPVLAQVKYLALLSQRFSASPTAGQAGTTGSAASRQSIVLPPRPPNPVRTEAQTNGNNPPPTDGSLSIAEHRKQFAPKRR